MGINNMSQDELWFNKYQEIVAFIESSYAAKVFYNDISIAYWRDANLNLKVNLTPKGSGWIKY